MSTEGYKFSRRLHLIIGAIGGLWLIFMSVTGLLINHQEALGLTEKEISDRFLPPYYRADVRTGTTRVNVIVVDLHSGRFFGKYGFLISDTIALLLVMSIVSGAYIYLFCNQQRATNTQNDAARKRPQDSSEMTGLKVNKLSKQTPTNRQNRRTLTRL